MLGEACEKVSPVYMAHARMAYVGVDGPQNATSFICAQRARGGCQAGWSVEEHYDQLVETPVRRIDADCAALSGHLANPSGSLHRFETAARPPAQVEAL
jgi:hypothetical protein